jgi:hypothetical protein
MNILRKALNRGVGVMVVAVATSSIICGSVFNKIEGIVN